MQPRIVDDVATDPSSGAVEEAGVEEAGVSEDVGSTEEEAGAGAEEEAGAGAEDDATGGGGGGGTYEEVVFSTGQKVELTASVLS